MVLPLTCYYPVQVLPRLGTTPYPDKHLFEGRDAALEEYQSLVIRLASACEENTYMVYPWSPFPLRRAHPGPERVSLRGLFL